LDLPAIALHLHLSNVRSLKSTILLLNGAKEAKSNRIASAIEMADNRTISQFEAEKGYPWIGSECCKGTVWVPFRMLRERIPMLSAMTLDQLGAKMCCDKCGKPPERYYPANQSDTPGFVQSF
jgi:hypothetical protein